MNDRWCVALAAAAWAGACRPSPLPLAAAVAAVACGVWLRRPAVVCLAVGLLVSALAWRSLAGLDGLRPGPVADPVTLLTDPAPSFAGVRAEARLGGRRVELQASGATAEELRHRLAGERLSVRGDLAPLPASGWSTSRHLSGRLRAHVVEQARPGDPASRVANGLRRTLVAGSSPLTQAQRSLYTGLVIGDDRHQPVAMSDDFRGAGLTHLLAVSGQNVAFVLVLAGPVLRRLRLWPRAIAAGAVVGLFAVATRFEPSVLRATAMVAVALVTSTLGSPVPRLRALALALAALLLVDPLLVRSTGFQLSVAATAAIVVGALPIAGALPGPRWLREPLAVTMAAQLGVAPLQLLRFGPVPLASLPANLLAVPAAGLVMVWGLTAGLVAGVAGGPVAEVAHVPTRVLLWWIATVARRAAALPLGHLGWWGSVAVTMGICGAAAARRRGRGRRLGRASLAVALASAAIAVVAAQAPAGLRTDLLPGLVRWQAGDAEVVVLGGAGGRTRLHDEAVLHELRAAGVRAIDLIVVADGAIDQATVTAVRQRHPTGTVVATDPSVVEGTGSSWAPPPQGPATIRIGGLEVVLVPTADRIVVEGRRAAG